MLDALFDWHVEGRQSFAAEGAVGGESMAPLKGFNGLDEGTLTRALRQARELATDGELASVAVENRAAATWLRYATRMKLLRAGSPGLIRLTDQASD